MKAKVPIPPQPILSEAKVVFKGIIFDVYQWQQKQFDGSYITFEKIKRADSALVIPVTEDGKIIIVEQEQPGVKKYSDFLGGRVNQGEDPLDAAKRELLEEAGLKAKEIVLWDAHHKSFKVESVVYIFIAKGCKKVQEPKLEVGEKIQLKYYTFEEFIDLVFSRPYEFTETVLKLISGGIAIDKQSPAIKNFKNQLLNV